MAGREKKPGITPQQRADWLNRFENGESPPKIAEADDVDVRTVRSHLEKAQMERDRERARSEVLRAALEGHYRDLMDAAEKMKRQVLNGSAIEHDEDAPLVSALKHHMPRSPLWANQIRWNDTLASIEQAKAGVCLWLEQQLAADTRLEGIESEGAEGILKALVDILVFQVKAWARGEEGLQPDRDFHFEEVEGSTAIVRYGFSHFGRIEKAQAAVLKEVVAGYEPSLRDRDAQPRMAGSR